MLDPGSGWSGASGGTTGVVPSSPPPPSTAAPEVNAYGCDLALGAGVESAVDVGPFVEDGGAEFEGNAADDVDARGGAVVPPATPQSSAGSGHTTEPVNPARDSSSPALEQTCHADPTWIDSRVPDTQRTL